MRVEPERLPRVRRPNVLYEMKALARQNFDWRRAENAAGELAVFRFSGTRYVLVAMLVVLAFLAPKPARAQVTPAGTDIPNTAQAVSTDAGLVNTTASNTVSTRVLGTFALRITPPGSVVAPAYALQAVPVDTVYCRLTLDNLGNAPDSVAMSTTSLPPSTIALAGVIFFYDANANSRLDPGEDDPSFLAVGAGLSTPVDVALVLPSSVGDAYVELRATSARDPSVAAAVPAPQAPATDATVVRVTSRAPVSSVFFGPAGNPRALPAGEGSADDGSTIGVGVLDDTVTFAGDIENAGDADSVVVFASTVFPPGVGVVCTDLNGVPFPPAPQTGRFLVGAFAPGEVRSVRVVVSSPGTPLRVSLGATLAFDFVAQSRLDTLVTNRTTCRLAVAAAPDPRTMIALEQTFRQATASLGDVVTMVVTATNRTDSIRVDNVRVDESVPPALDFLSGNGVAWSGNQLAWAVGSLAPGETRTTSVKFAVNSREPNGWASVSGVARGSAATGDPVETGPVVAAIRIDNEEVGIEGFLLGDVWIDDDGDGHRDDGERGVGNVSVYLESGEYAVTDSLGVFSIPHVFEGYRLVRLQEGTLPAGVELAPPAVDDGHAPRPNERLVHLIAPAHARVAFPLRQPAVPTPTRTALLACEERISVAPPARPSANFSLPSSQFDFGQASLVVGADRVLQPVASFLLDRPGWAALVEGHTDSAPMHSKRFPSNYELSVARAAAVRDALVAMGVDGDRIVVLGYGDTRPIAGNGTPEGRSFNRRVEVSFIPPTADGADPALRVGHAIRDLSVLPDSSRMTVRWIFTTTSEHTQRGTIRVEAPPGLADVTVSADLDGVPLSAAAGGFTVESLARGRSIDCRVTFSAAVPDTHLVHDITATIALVDSAAGETGEVRTAVVRPGMRTDAAPGTVFDALTWTEIAAPMEADSAAGPVAVPPAAPGGDLVTILEPNDGFVVRDRDQVAVRVRHPLGSRVELRVNDELVGEDRVGQHTVDVAHEQEITTWFGVRVRTGWNDVVARAAMLRGGEVCDSVRIALSSKPAELVPLDARALIPADGRASAVLRFAVRDGFGLPVMDGIVVTVAEGADLVALADARPDERGLQATTSEGLVNLIVKPRHATGGGRVAVEMDGMRAETEVVFVNPERPFLADGIVDVSMGAYDTRGGGSGQGVANYQDGFDVKAESRLFVQGAAPGGVQVTARLDTRKRYDDPLLKQPDPEKQYPIYGDASSLHYSAPARGGNYLSIDREQSYLRYGDFTTPIDRGEFLTYHQVVTGLSASLTDGPNSVRAFVTETDFVTRTDEMPADGTSGFYYLSRAPIVENSERVIIETRDRYQTEAVLEARVMVRRRDYTINPYDGSILFMEPVTVTDRELNPNFIAVTYETETGTSGGYLFGMRGDVLQGSRYRAGLTAVANSGDTPGYSLFGMDGDARLGAARFSGEFAHSEDDLTGSGNAYKVGAGAQRGASKLDLYLRSVDGGFVNPSFRGADSELASLKAGFDGRLALSPSLALNADGYTHELQRTDETRETTRATLDYRRRLLEMSAGLRVARHEEPQQDANGVLVLAGITVGNRGTAGISTTWEQNVGDEVVDDYPNRLKTVLALPLAKRFRAIATHEYLTASGRASTNQITAGVEGTTAGGTQAYTRYAMDRAGDDARMGAVSGIRQKLQLGPTTGATLGFETLTSLSGRDDEEYLSLSAGLGARRPGAYFVDGGYEYRWERPGDKHLVRMSAAQQLGGGFAWLAKNILGLGERDGANDETQFYATLAGAYRSPFAPVQSLVMLKSYYDRYAPIDPDAIRWRMVATTDVNVMPTPAHELRFKYAYKHVEDWSYGASATTNTDLALAQYVWHFGRGWDVDAWGRAVATRGGGTAQAGAGVELGRLVYRSVRIGVGYSVNGFDDPDVTATDAWSAGFGVRIQMLLSDWLLADFERLK
jgi:outer membrane protein OmpA-like peptidoglycan-associated protein